MGAKAEVVSGLPDALKWALSTVVLVAGLGAFYYYADESLLYRVVGLLIAAGLSIYLGSQTGKGREITGFVRDARIEVRKVVWPTRKETTQTTGIVLVVVFLVAIMLWILDTMLGWLVSKLLGWGL
jgi:preprotein translocase subunit SecE